MAVDVVDPNALSLSLSLSLSLYHIHTHTQTHTHLAVDVVDPDHEELQNEENGADLA